MASLVAKQTSRLGWRYQSPLLEDTPKLHKYHGLGTNFLNKTQKLLTINETNDILALTSRFNSWSGYMLGLQVWSLECQTEKALSRSKSGTQAHLEEQWATLWLPRQSMQLDLDMVPSTLHLVL